MSPTTKSAPVLAHFVEGRWHVSSGRLVPIYHAVSGEMIAQAGSDDLDFKAILSWGRHKGGAALRKLSAHQRAAMLKALGGYLLEHKERLYQMSKPTGATRADSWIDIEGGIGTLFTYASKGRREMQDESFFLDGPVERLSKNNTFIGRHICAPLEGVALHINAFNFPCWGMLEKLAPTWLAGMPALVKPATSSAYLAKELVQLIDEAKILPEGALQLVCGGLGDIFSHLSCQDVVTFTGSKATGSKLKSHPRVVDQSVRFNLEADSLNCAVLGEKAIPGSKEFALFVKEVVRELTVKAGQKCTTIRRVLLPEAYEEECLDELRRELLKVQVGNPENEKVRMGPLIGKEQVKEVQQQVEVLLQECEWWSKERLPLSLLDAEQGVGGFFPKTVLRCKEPDAAKFVHEVEAFGPVCVVMSYKSQEQAIELARRGAGSLCATVCTPDENEANQLFRGLAPYHGRILLLNEYCAAESTGHGSPLPHLVHGGPGRAGGGEELGGLRSVLHYMQRTAVQGAPQQVTALGQQWVTGAALKEESVHPFRKFFEELEIGDSLLTDSRVLGESEVAAFAQLSGDHFYLHTEEEAARASIFGAKVVHGYLVLSAAAGLFVDPAPGPVLANYGLEELRFIQPVYFNDAIRVRLTCKQKTKRAPAVPSSSAAAAGSVVVDRPHGVVHWEVEVVNQRGELVARYVLLTLVESRG